MTSLPIQRFDAATDDYDALAALWTRCHPEMPRAGDVWRIRDEQARAENAPAGRYIALRDGVLVGMSSYDDCPVAGEAGQLQVDFAVPPGGDAREILEALVGAMRVEVEAHNPPVLVGYAPDDRPDVVAFFEDHDFVAAQRTVCSIYHPRGDEAARVAGVRRGLTGAGYDLLPLSLCMGPDDAWMRPYHALSVAVVNDIPFLGPVHEETFEAFEQRVKDPTRFDPATTFVARERRGGELVGVALLSTYAHLPGYGFAGLTGVLPTHRRRGIARGLKLETLAWAASNGIDRIVTLNEEDNPMLLLNRELGFATKHIQFTMQKRLIEA